MRVFKTLIKTITILIIGQTKFDYELKKHGDFVYYSHIFKDKYSNSITQKWYLHKDGIITEINSNLEEIDVASERDLYLKPDLEREYKFFIEYPFQNKPIIIDYYPEKNFVCYDI